MDDFFQEICDKLKWERWTYKAGHLDLLRRSIPPIPAKHGVYILRASRPLGRVRGFSDVIYIGQSGGGERSGKQGIGPGNGGPGRLFNTRGPDKLVREKIEGLYSDEEFIVECSFTENIDPEAIEEALLAAYLQTHCELPPANHQLSLRSLRSLR